MKSSLHWIAVAAFSTLFAVGCKKKDAVGKEVAREAEQKLPAQEQVSPGADSAPGAPSSNGAPITASAAPSNVDQAAYEAWFKKHHLDLNDPKMLDADPDGDGYTNREEFLANTDPHDKNSHPAFHTDPRGQDAQSGVHKGIRLKEYNEVRLPLILESIEGDKARLKRTDQPDAKSITVKVGDTIHGLPLKVTQVEEKQDFDKGGEKIDISHVALEDSSTKEKINLLKDLPARTSATYAVLSSPDGKTTMKVSKGDVFSWPGEADTHYKVIDLSSDQAVLLQMEQHKTWTIPRM
jgi:hypothetical protein